MKNIIILLLIFGLYVKANSADPEYYIPTSSAPSVNTVNSDMTFNNNVNINALVQIAARITANQIVQGDLPASLEGQSFGIVFSSPSRGTASLQTQADRFGPASGALDYGQPPFIAFTFIPSASFSTTTTILSDPNANFLDSYVDKKYTVSFPLEYLGATADILEVINSTQIVLAFPDHGDEEIDDMTTGAWIISDRPIYEIMAGGDVRFQIGDDNSANFEIVCPTATSDNTFLVDSVCGVNGHSTTQVNTDVNGCSSTFGTTYRYNINGFDDSSDFGAVINIIITNEDASGDADAHGIEFSVTDPDNNDVEVEAIAVRPGLDVIRQYLGTATNLGIGLNENLGVYVDSTTAFSTSTVNVPIFDNVLDSIVIGAVAKFDQMNVLLTQLSSKSIAPIFSYSTGGVMGFSTFTVSDNTAGFQAEGSISWEASKLIGWSTASITEITGGDLIDSTTYFFIEIVRTATNITPNEPIEERIQVTALGTDYRWTKQGDIQCKTVSIVDSIDAPSAIAGQAITYIDNADGNYKIIFGDGTIKTLTTNP